MNLCVQAVPQDSLDLCVVMSVMAYGLQLLSTLTFQPVMVLNNVLHTGVKSLPRHL